MNPMNNNFNNNIYNDPQKATRKWMFIHGSGAGLAVLGFLFIQFLASFVIGVLAVFMSNNTPEYIQSILNNYLITGIISILSCVLPFSVYALIAKVDIKSSYKKSNLRAGFKVSLYFIAIGVCMAANYVSDIVQRIFSIFGLQPIMPDIYVPKDPANIIIFFIAIAVIPAIVEEFATRVVLLNSLKKWGEKFAIIISATVFGLMHGNFVQIPFAFVVGLMLGYLAVKTGTIWLSMLVHFSNNFISALLSVLGNYLNSYVIVILNIATMIVPILIGLIVFLIVKVRQKYSLALTPQQPLAIKRSEAAFYYFISPAMLIAIGVLMWMATTMIQTI